MAAANPQREIANARLSFSLPAHQPQAGAVFVRRLSPQGGIGCFARAGIPQGTCILEERSLFQVPWNYTNAHITAQFNSLTPFQRGRYNGPQGLVSANPNSRTLRDIFDANKFLMAETAAQVRRAPRGIFLKASRFNHSCALNAWMAWNSQLNNGVGAVTIFATKSIPAHQEILVSYMFFEDLCQSASMRFTFLNDGYNFRCACPPCDPAANPSSEANRMELNRLTDKIEEAQNNLTRTQIHTMLPSEYPSWIQDCIGLMIAEQLYYPGLYDRYKDLADYYHDIRSAAFHATPRNEHSRVQNKANSLAAARCALGYAIMASGEDSQATRDILGFLWRNR